jgi:predicted nuclease with TOPRIM domain
MSDEIKNIEAIEDDISELELEDDALEKKMRKLEQEVSRLLDHSNELIREMSKGKATQEEDVKSEGS